MEVTQIINRYDTAHPGRFHIKLMLAAGSTWIWVAYGVTIIGFIIPSLKDEWGITASALGLLAGLGMLGMLVGAVTAGWLADRYGRRKVLIRIMLVQAVLFLLSALAQSYQQLLWLRFFLGIGLGAALPVAGTLVSEFSPTRIRGMLMVLLNTFWAFGATLAALVGYLIVINAGWRLAMGFGGLAGLCAILVRVYLPESFRYLWQKGYQQEVLKQDARIDLESEGVAPHLGKISQNPVIEESGSRAGIWSRQYAPVTVALWYLWISLNFLYQGVYVWLPTLLSDGQAGVSHAYQVTLFISLGQVPGTFLAAFLADRFSRRYLLIISQVLVGLSTALFPLMDASWYILTLGFFIMMFNGMSMGLGHPFTAELYPTRIRGRANGWASGIGRLGGVAAPLVVGAAVQAGASLPVIFLILAAAPFSTTAALAWVKRETTGKSLEEIHAEN
jgi:putative MFS transporter